MAKDIGDIFIAYILLYTLALAGGILVEYLFDEL